MKLDFFVAGIPAPKGSLVAVQRGVYLESSRKTLDPWLGAIRTEIKKHAAVAPIKGSLNVAVIFYLPRPKTVIRPYPSVKPDVDKLLRGLFDGLKGLIEDDAQIVSVQARKQYADYPFSPGARVIIEPFYGL